MKEPKQHPLDDLSQPDSHFLEISKKLVIDLKTLSPYSATAEAVSRMLEDCGRILKYRIFVHNKRKP